MAEDRLTATEEAAWAGFLHAHAELWRELEKRLAPSGLNMNDYAVLVTLQSAGESGVRMTDLAKRTRMSSGGFTRLADRLQAQGLIERRRCDSDGRGSFAVITPAGADRLGSARVGHLDDVRELFLNHLSDEELRSMGDSFARIRAAAADTSPSC